MKIIVVSDNHGRSKPLSTIISAHPDADAYIHCGDSEMSLSELTPFVTVQGNNDYYNEAPKIAKINLGEIVILVTHGHRLPYGNRKEALVDLGIAEGCNLVCWGHTHVFDVYKSRGITVVNPGSLYYNRDGTSPSYAVIHYEDGALNVERIDMKLPVKTTKTFRFFSK
ncbi:MAG: YfcE family phosphodiesterase [Erysipelotrichaceae bacterium]|jgi:putative phosphoesterase|nr:YfcE family phosphodiesterase [Erysipelotrichaceae bacterium]